MPKSLWKSPPRSGNHAVCKLGMQRRLWLDKSCELSFWDRDSFSVLHVFRTWLGGSCTLTATVFFIFFHHLLARKIVVKMSLFTENKRWVMNALFFWGRSIKQVKYLELIPLHKAVKWLLAAIVVQNSLQEMRVLVLKTYSFAMSYTNPTLVIVQEFEVFQYTANRISMQIYETTPSLYSIAGCCKPFLIEANMEQLHNSVGDVLLFDCQAVVKIPTEKSVLSEKEMKVVGLGRQLQREDEHTEPAAKAPGFHRKWEMGKQSICGYSATATPKDWKGSWTSLQSMFPARRLK